MQDNPIENICRAGLALVKEHATLFSLETALAKQSIVPFVASAGCALLLLISIWLTILIMTAYGIYFQTQDIWLSFGLTLGLQLLLFMIAVLMIRQYQQRLKFKETRSHLKDYFGHDHGH